MKIKIFGGIAVLVFAIIIGLNIKMNSNKAEMSDLALANVEALAGDEELPEVVVSCGRTEGRCWADNGKDIEWTPFGPIYTTTCYFSGWQGNYCIKDLPAY